MVLNVFTMSFFLSFSHYYFSLFIHNIANSWIPTFSSLPHRVKPLFIFFIRLLLSHFNPLHHFQNLHPNHLLQVLIFNFNVLCWRVFEIEMVSVLLLYNLFRFLSLFTGKQKDVPESHHMQWMKWSLSCYSTRLLNWVLFITKLHFFFCLYFTALLGLGLRLWFSPTMATTFKGIRKSFKYITQIFGNYLFC